MLNAVLIPRYEVQGAIIATFTSYFVCYVIRLIDARRYVPFRVSHLRFFVNMAVLFLMCSFVMMTDVRSLDYGTYKGFPPLLLAGGLLLLAGFNYKPLLATAMKLLRRKK